MRILKALKEFILNTLFPPVCVSCKKEGDFLCINCLRGLSKKKIRGSYHYSDKKDPDIHHLNGVIYGLDYAKNPSIQAAVKQFKYRFTEEMAEWFADLMVEKIRELKMTKNRRVILIPVPLHKKRLNYRGFNQAEVIAKAIQNRLPTMVEIRPYLERVRHTDQQAKLDKEGRHRNLKGAFKIRNTFCHSDRRRDVIYHISMNKKCIQEQKNCSQNPIYFLVDDVFTTGATLESCAEILKSNGFKKVYGLVVARSFK